MHMVQSVPTQARHQPAAATLLTVSGTIPDDIDAQVASGSRPRIDYLEMSRAFPADLLDVAAARQLTGWFGRLLERFGGKHFLIAWACFLLRNRYAVIFTDGEQIGILLAFLLKFLHFGRRPRHLMIVHILSVRKKMLFFDWLRVQSHIDTFLVYSSWQQRFILQRWALPSERVVFTPFMVDTAYFSPEHARPEPLERPMICSVGMEARDYPTLLEAVAGLPVDVIIVAGSFWSKRADTTRGRPVPPNVTVGRYSWAELRQVYANCSLMVMPLQNVNFQAGVTALLEAMAMGKPVICSRSPGQSDVVIEGKTGLYVPPGDAAALRAAIEELIANPTLREAMGQAGRRRIDHEMNLDRYIEHLARHIRLQLEDQPLEAARP